MAFENWRFNPFTGETNSKSITDEEHTIEYHADWNGNGIQLDESPELEVPSVVSIVEAGTGGATFTEVPRTQAPSSGEYRVDYDSSSYYGTGRVEFNSADLAKDVLVTYKGNGSIVKSAREFNVPMDMNVIGDVVIDGTLNNKGNVDFDGNLDVNGESIDFKIDGDNVINVDINKNIKIDGATIYLKIDGVDAQKISANKIITLPKQPSARAYNGTYQAIPSAAWTKVVLNVEDFDILGEFDSVTNYRYTATENGIYIILAQISWAGAGVDNITGISVKKNGADAVANTRAVPNNYNRHHVIATTLQLVATDYLELFAYQGSPFAWALYQNTQNTYMSVHKIS